MLFALACVCLCRAWFSDCALTIHTHTNTHRHSHSAQMHIAGTLPFNERFPECELVVLSAVVRFSFCHFYVCLIVYVCSCSAFRSPFWRNTFTAQEGCFWYVNTQHDGKTYTLATFSIKKWMNYVWRIRAMQCSRKGLRAISVCVFFLFVLLALLFTLSLFLFFQRVFFLFMLQSTLMWIWICYFYKKHLQVLGCNWTESAWKKKYTLNMIVLWPSRQISFIMLKIICGSFLCWSALLSFLFETMRITFA